MNKCVLIFDFDGTIADTHHYICDISNKICEKYNYNKIDFNDLPYMKDLTAKEVIKYLDVPLLKIPAILAHAKKEFQHELEKLEPFKNLKETLYQLKDKVAGIGILSSNSQENVVQFLANHNIKIFDFIHTTSKVWSKNVSLKKLISKYNLQKDDVIYIGDETRDISAARKLGVRVAAVSWGYNSQKILKEHQPDYLFNQPEELLELC